MYTRFLTPALLVFSAFAAAQGNDAGAPTSNSDGMIYGYQPSSQPSDRPPMAIGSVDDSFGGPSGNAGGFTDQPPVMMKMGTASQERVMMGGDGMAAGPSSSSPSASPDGGSRIVLVGSSPQYKLPSSESAMMSSDGMMMPSSGSGMGSSSADVAGQSMGGAQSMPMDQSAPGVNGDPNDDGEYYPETDPNASGSGSNPYDDDIDNDDYDGNENDDDGYPEYPDADDYTAVPIATGSSTLALPTMASATVPALSSVTGSVIPTGNATGIPVFEGAAGIGRYSNGACWMLAAVAAGAAFLV